MQPQAPQAEGWQLAWLRVESPACAGKESMLVTLVNNTGVASQLSSGSDCHEARLLQSDGTHASNCDESTASLIRTEW